MDLVGDVSEPHPLTESEQCALDEIRRLMMDYTRIRFQTDQYFLTKYLRAADWSPQKAFDQMRRIYKLKVWNEKQFECVKANQIKNYSYIERLSRLLRFKTLFGI